MEPAANNAMRVLKRLRAAIGYDELGMSAHALRSLDSLASLGDIGPFALIADFLRGEFSKARENRIDLAMALGTAAGLLPTPVRQAVEMTLAACNATDNDRGRAANNRAVDRGVRPETPSKPAC
jgi:hypothetical protein